MVYRWEIFHNRIYINFLGIETSEVIETTKKVLLVYKENINQFIDKAVDIATGSSLVLKKDK